MDEFHEQLEHLQKDRRVLAAEGATVFQECRGIISEIQRAFRRSREMRSPTHPASGAHSRERGKHI